MKQFLIIVTLAAIAYAAKYVYLKPKFSIGSTFPSIKADLHDGTPLVSLNENYVLVDFWASWCRPCREDNPKIVDLYNKFKNKNFKDASGFKVLSIGLENNKNQWQKAVEHDKLDWPTHVFQENGFDGPLAKSFGVREIPTKYFIGPNQKIIFVNPAIEEITGYLKEKQVR